MPKILLVAYHYPPAPVVGSVRPSKFAFYLPPLGWQPIVLTVRNNTEEVDVPPGAVYRVSEWPHPLKSYYEYKEKRAFKNGHDRAFVLRTHGSYADVMVSSRSGLRGLKQWLINFMYLPDQELGWLFPAVAKGLHLIQQNKITHVITTAPPFTSHLVGLILKRLTGIHWVADFRDPWSLENKYRLWRNRVTDAIESKLIQWVMQSSDLVTSVTPPMTDQFRKEHIALDPTKFMTLTNGFDPKDFEALTPLPIRSCSMPVTFTYLGEFYDGRTPKPFLICLRELLNAGVIGHRDVQVHLIGKVAFAEGESVAEMIDELHLKDVVSLRPSIPRADALRKALEYHVSLVLTEKHAHALPLKFFEALGAGMVILNIGSPGPLGDILALTGRGVSVDYRNKSEIKSGIMKCMEQVKSGGQLLSSNPWEDPSVHAFSYEQITASLVSYLNFHKAGGKCS